MSNKTEWVTTQKETIPVKPGVTIEVSLVHDSQNPGRRAVALSRIAAAFKENPERRTIFQVPLDKLGDFKAALQKINP